MDNKDKNLKDENMGQELTRDFLRFVTLKTERLIQSVYLVSSFMNDREPIKWKIRESSLELLSTTSVLNPDTVSYDSLSGEIQVSPLFKLSVLESVLDKIKEIISLLTVLVVGGLISEMNFSLLQREFLSLSRLIENKVGKKSLENNLKALPETSEDKIMRAAVSDINTTKKTASEERESLPHRPSLSKTNIMNSSEPGYFLKDGNKESRKETIVNFLKDKGWTSIKDIADVVPGCSTKTIQRELSDLVKKGVLKKKGDRRWSRYLRE